MTTYSQVASGGAYGAGAASINSNQKQSLSGGGVYGGGKFLGSLKAKADRAIFLSQLRKGGSVYMIQPHGGYVRSRIAEFIPNEWGDGHHTTVDGGTVVFGDGNVTPQGYLGTLNIVYDINTKDAYSRFLNDVR